MEKTMTFDTLHSQASQFEIRNRSNSPSNLNAQTLTSHQSWDQKVDDDAKTMGGMTVKSLKSRTSILRKGSNLNRSKKKKLVWNRSASKRAGANYLDMMEEQSLDKLGFKPGMTGKEMLGIIMRDDLLLNLLVNDKEELRQLWKLQCGEVKDTNMDESMAVLSEINMSNDKTINQNSAFQKQISGLNQAINQTI